MGASAEPRRMNLLGRRTRTDGGGNQVDGQVRGHTRALQQRSGPADDDERHSLAGGGRSIVDGGGGGRRRGQRRRRPAKVSARRARRQIGGAEQTPATIVTGRFGGGGSSSAVCWPLPSSGDPSHCLPHGHLMSDESAIKTSKK